MREVFEFSANEVMNILVEGLYNNNKIPAGEYNVTMITNSSFGKLDNVQLKFGSSIPPPPKDRYI